MKGQLPLIFFATAFFILVLGLFSKYTSKQLMQSTQTSSLYTISVTPFIPTLNYDLPITCNLSNSTSSFSAELRGTALRVVYKTKNQELQTIEVHDDCIYQGNGTGSLVKTRCGVGKVVEMAKTLLSTRLLSADNIQSAITQSGRPLPFNAGQIMRSCKNSK